MTSNSLLSKAWVKTLALVFIIGIGLFVRLEDLSKWKKLAPGTSFHQGEPLLVGHDGYYYLRLARDLVEDTYTPTDQKRTVPESPPRPSPPPLLPVAAAFAANVTPFSLNWIGAVLPALFGVLIVFPLYGLGRIYHGPVMGLAAALLGVLVPTFARRSGLGWFDTDCMNVTWTLALTYCLLKFGLATARSRTLYLSGAALIYALFLWWWDQAPALVNAVALLQLGVALIFLFRPRITKGLLPLIPLALLLALLFWQGKPFLPEAFLERVDPYWRFISKDVSGEFPNIGITVSELRREDLGKTVDGLTAGWATLIFSLSGFVLLLVQGRSKSLFLVVPLLLGGLTFLANRFSIFLTPIVALGFGYLMAWLWDLPEHGRWGYLIASRSGWLFPVLILVFFLAWPSANHLMRQTTRPCIPAQLAAGLERASRNLPEDAVMWTWWDIGYAATYWTRRATVRDGQIDIQSGEPTVYNAIPFASPSFRLAANFMQFYVTRGMTGIRQFYQALNHDKERGLKLIKEILAAGPVGATAILEGLAPKPVANRKTTEDWLKLFFPDQPRSVYLLLNTDLLRTPYWWYWFGTWDIGKRDGTHPRFRLFGTERKGPYLFDLSDRRALFDFEKKKLHQSFTDPETNTGFPLRSLFIYPRTYESFAPHGVYLAILPQRNIAVLTDENMERTLFSRLFIEHRALKGYFSLFEMADLKSPHYQIWRVKGDRISESHRPP